jgi:hypothetical protein
MIAFRGAGMVGLVGAAACETRSDKGNYPLLSCALIVQIEGGFAACSAERLAFLLVLWNTGNVR